MLRTRAFVRSQRVTWPPLAHCERPTILRRRLLRLTGCPAEGSTTSTGGSDVQAQVSPAEPGARDLDDRAEPRARRHGVRRSTATHGDKKADTKLIKKLAPSLSVKHAKTATTRRTRPTRRMRPTPTSATTATTADNATNLGGQPASAYVPSTAVQRGTFVGPGDDRTGAVPTDGPALRHRRLHVELGCSTTVTVSIVFDRRQLDLLRQHRSRRRPARCRTTT